MRPPEDAELEPEPFVLGAWVGSLVSAPDGALASVADKLSVRDLSDSARVRATKGLLATALASVVDNALRAHATNASLRAVSLVVSSDPESVQITVEDSGVGMAPALAVRAGEPFFTTRDAGEGMGLGLYLARSTLARHGGGLELTSGPTGTTVVMRLPRVRD
ncbi:MAG: HAMP domain-containing sensor histidine kinase [Deltaproteobacteria bacterium]|nr:HAMP domain-containing sensor histidine kinase [Deltaproteobacteria bacterium]